MTRADLIALVRLKMEELMPFDEGLVVLASNNPTKAIDTYIDELLPETINEILKFAPLTACVPIVYSAETITITNGVGKLVLPADFLRIGIIKFTEWQRPVTSLITEGSVEYNQQKNTYSRAGVAKPKVALIQEADTKYLEMFSFVSTSNPAGRHISYIQIVPDNFTDFSMDKLIPAITWFCAGKVLGIYENQAYKVAIENGQKSLIASG